MTTPVLPPAPRGASRGLAVAVSGGADSTALLSLLSASFPGRLLAVHVNHRLRGGASEADERHVRRLCRALGVPLAVVRLSDWERDWIRSGNLEERAREARYGRLAALVRRRRLWGAATAHHREDRAETVLDHLLRGAGGRGLSALRPLETLPFGGRQLRLWRPLLAFGRCDLREYLREAGLSFREDASNRDPTRRRNRLRHCLLPALERFAPGASRSLARAAEILAAEEEVLEAATRRALRSAGFRKGRTGASLRARAYLRLPLALRRRAARVCLAALEPRARGLSFEAVEIVRAVWEGSLRGPRDAGRGLSVSRDGPRLRIEWKNLTQRTRRTPRTPKDR